MHNDAAHTTRAIDDDAEDLRLVAAIRRGETSAWSAFIARYQDRLFSICLRMVHNRDLAADLTQDAFVKLIQGIDSFDGRSKLSTWATRVTMNVCLSKLRAEKLRRHASIDALTDNGDQKFGGRQGAGPGGGGFGVGFEQDREPAAEESVQYHEDRRLVMLALRELDADQRAVLILCDCRGHSYEEIADTLGVAVGTVKSRLFRARTALRDAVEALAKKETEAARRASGRARAAE